MTLHQDRVVRFGELSGGDIEGKSTVEFTNIPTDFCKLEIHGIGRTLIKDVGQGANADFIYLNTYFQGIAATGLSGVLTGTATRQNGNNYNVSRTMNQQSSGTSMLGWGGEFTPASFGADYGGDQFLFRYYVMEPGSSRSKSVQFETFFQTAALSPTNNAASTWQYGQHRIDAQAGVTGASYATKIFDSFKITLTGANSATPHIVFAPGSRIWLEGWGGGHP
jgi:hypothetical protein